MEKDQLSRKLAVILHADVVGSTSLVQQNETLTHERIQSAFNRLAETINNYGGLTREIRGDALVAEFDRASDAVSAALTFQVDHTYQVSRIKDDLRPTIRVGIAMGEVVIADDTVTGAGVVLAQRVEQLADPGGVCITAALHEALPNHMPFDLENLGEQELKGFDEPVRVYRVELSAGQSVPSPEKFSQRKISSKKSNFMAATVVLVVFIGGIFYWFQAQEPQLETASEERMAFPLPDKPSIAVLPFTNMSNDVEQEFFADGMTEDLITDISKISGLFVIARNSVFAYKGKSVKVRQVAEELGVRYVMEGSVRRVGNQVRINAQLIDATTGGHLWAERYDGSLDDVFAMQDKITQKIVTALSVTLTSQEEDNRAKVETDNPDAHDAFLRGWERYRQGTPEDFVKAISFFEQAIDLDPDYAQAYSALAAVDWSVNFNGWARSIGIYPFQARYRSWKSLKKAMEKPSALTYQVSSERSTLFYRKPDKALREAGQAIAFNANDPAGHLAMAAALLKAGKPVEAANSVRTAMRLDPEYPAYYLHRLAQAQYQMGAFQDAIETLESSAKRNPEDDWTFVYLVAAYGQLGDKGKVKKALERANELRAKAGWGALTIELAADRGTSEETRYLFKWFGDLKSLRDGLRKAGVPNGNEWRSLVTREDTGVEVKGAVSIDNNTAKMLHERGVPFIDVFYHWDRKRIPRAHYLEMWSYDFNEVRLSKIIQKNQDVVLYSTWGDGERWLIDATALAVTWGYEKIHYYKDGLSGWEKAGYPIDKAGYPIDKEKIDVWH